MFFLVKHRAITSIGDGDANTNALVLDQISICVARDSLVGMALILHLLADTGQNVTELLSSLPHYVMIKEKLTCPSYKIDMVLSMLRQEYAGYQMDTRDGVKVIVPAGWFLVRGSNTEPIIRVVAEAENENRATEIVNSIFAQQAPAKRNFDAEIQAATQSAKTAAGFEHLGTLVRTCLLPQRTNSRGKK